MSTDQIRQAFSNGTLTWGDLLEITGLHASVLYEILWDLINVPKGIDESDYHEVLSEAFYNE